MYNIDLNFSPEELEMPDIPFEEFVIEELPYIDTLLRTTETVNSPPPTTGQTTYTQSITIRVPHWLVAELKKRAAKRGERYQSYINLVLSQHVKS